jgi:hypothetical protein
VRQCWHLSLLARNGLGGSGFRSMAPVACTRAAGTAGVVGCGCTSRCDATCFVSTTCCCCCCCWPAACRIVLLSCVRRCAGTRPRPSAVLALLRRTGRIAGNLLATVCSECAPQAAANQGGLIQTSRQLCAWQSTACCGNVLRLLL